MTAGLATRALAPSLATTLSPSPGARAVHVVPSYPLQEPYCMPGPEVGARAGDGPETPEQIPAYKEVPQARAYSESQN